MAPPPGQPSASKWLPSINARFVAQLLTVGVSYFLLGKLGLLVAHGAEGSSWPPAGLAVAAPLLLGYRVWPGILAGAIGLGLTTETSLPLLAALAAGNTIEGLCGAWLANRFARGRYFWERPRDLAKFSVLVCFLTPLISPPFGLSRVSFSAFPFWTADADTFMTCWMGEIMSVMLVTPLVVMIGDQRRERLNRSELIELAALFLGLGLVTGIVFGPIAPRLQAHMLPYLCLGFTVAIAFRHGSHATATATVLMSVIALLGTVHGHGLFAGLAREHALLALQGFIVFSAGTNLAVAAVVTQRERAMRALRSAHGELEERVEERTRELQKEIEERKRTEAALKEAEAGARKQLAELCQIYDATPAGLFVMDQNLRYQRLNQRLAKLNGKPVGAHLGKTMHDILPAFYADVLREAIRPVIESGKPVLDFEISGEAPGGQRTIRHFLASFYPLRADTKEVAGVMGAVMDITDRKRAEETLRASEERYRSLVELSPDAIILLRGGRIILANSAALQLFGAAEPGQLVGSSLFKLLHADGHAPMRQRIHGLLQGHPRRLTEERIIQLNGRLVDVEVSASTFVENGRRVFQFIMRDISERKAMEQALANSESRYRRLFETARIGLLIVDSKTARIAEVNPFLMAMLACSRAEVIGSRPWDLEYFRSNKDQCQSTFREVQQTGFVHCGRLMVRTKSRGEILAELTANTYVVDGAQVIQCSFRDISARVRAEEALQQTLERLDELVNERTLELTVTNESLNKEIKHRREAEGALAQVLDRLVDAQENERKRVSRELHDRMGQEISVLKLRLSFLQPQLLPTQEARERLQEAERIADDIGSGMHRLAWELRPPALDDLGLEAALRHLSGKWSEYSGIPCDFVAHGMEETRLSPKVETTLYRLTQEALSNVLKHSRATQANAILERRFNDITLIIEDNGRGFDAPATLASHGKSDRLGLLGMQERVLLVGGSIDFESGSGQGTSVFVRVPFQARTAPEK